MFRRRSEPWHRGTRPTHGDRAKGAGSRRAAPSRTASRARGGASPSVATSPDGSAIALERMNTGSTPDHVVVIRPPAPAATVVFSAKAPFESSLCWSPDGARIAVSTDNAHDPRRCGRRQRCDHAVRDQRQNVVLAALDSRSRQTDRRVHPATDRLAEGGARVRPRQFVAHLRRHRGRVSAADAGLLAPADHPAGTRRTRRAR